MPVIKQHFVPQFIMRNFTDEHNLLTIIDKNSSPTRIIATKPNAVLFENDMYETRNLDGSYYDRNVIIESTAYVILEMLEGGLKPRVAYAQGMIKVYGSADLLDILPFGCKV